MNTNHAFVIRRTRSARIDVARRTAQWACLGLLAVASLGCAGASDGEDTSVQGGAVATPVPFAGDASWLDAQLPEGLRLAGTLDPVHFNQYPGMGDLEFQYVDRKNGELATAGFDLFMVGDVSMFGTSPDVQVQSNLRIV